MNVYISQIREKFGSWGTIFSVEELLSKAPSPFKRLIESGFSKINSKLIFSVCPDEINRIQERKTIENKIKSAFGDEFHLGTLAAYPIGGVAGLTAASHHAPEIIDDNRKKLGNLIIFISPHIGLTVTNNEVRFGYVKRPGQSTLSTSCGAMMSFLKLLQQASSLEEIMLDDEGKNPAKRLLFTKLLNACGKEIMDDLKSNKEPNEIVMKLTKFNYELVFNDLRGIIQGFLENESFDGQFAIVGGITINTEKEDFFIFRDYALNSIP